MIVLQGTGSDGKPFTTNFFVFRSQGKSLVQNVIWWSGKGMAQALPRGAATEGPSAPASCPE